MRALPGAAIIALWCIVRDISPKKTLAKVLEWALQYPFARRHNTMSLHKLHQPAPQRVAGALRQVLDSGTFKA